MRYHIDVLGRLHGAWGSLANLGPVSRAGHAAVWILVASGAALVIAGGAMIAAGRAVRRHRPRGRSAAIALALPNLVLVPFGTALGVYTLWVLLNDDARCAFGRPPHLASSVPTSMEEDL